MSANQVAASPYNIIGILDGEESDIGFFGMRKNYIGWGEAESDIIFPNPKKPYIGRLDIQYSCNIVLNLNSIAGPGTLEKANLLKKGKYYVN